jgi:ribosome-associated protein
MAEGMAGGGPEEAPGIKLDQFLKWKGVAPTGGQAKLLVQGGAVRVNGEVETRRGRRLRRGDRVEVGGRRLVVE